MRLKSEGDVTTYDIENSLSEFSWNLRYKFTMSGAWRKRLSFCCKELCFSISLGTGSRYYMNHLFKNARELILRDEL